MTTRQQAQAKLVIDEFARRGIPLAAHRGAAVATGTGTGDPPLQFFYRPGYILVRDEYLDRVQRLVGLNPAAVQPGDILPVVRGVRRIRLPAGKDAVTTLADVRAGSADLRLDGLGAGVAAPDHFVSITPGEGGLCPATEPDQVPATSPVVPPQVDDPNAGQGIRVVVVDTGLDTDAPGTHSWMTGVDGDPDPAIVRSGGGLPNQLKPYAGHGTFIAGVVRAMAPAAEVIVRSVFTVAGGVFESDLVRALDAVLENDFPDVISLSAGTWTFNATGLLGFDVFNETRLSHHKGIVLVAAAGNDADRREFWPAAAPYTLSVGALAANGHGRASFTNFGGWVDLYAPGENLVNAYPSGEYTYQEPPRTGTVGKFTGMASWSGTSFATPLVAGLIAARMSRTGENGRDAAAALLARARSQAQPGVGAVLP